MRDLRGDLHRSVTRGATSPVGHRHQRWLQRLEPTDRIPEVTGPSGVFGEELEREERPPASMRSRTDDRVAGMRGF